ncbi:MAG: UPF0158 family protein [Saprospiraceae bacterium]
MKPTNDQIKEISSELDLGLLCFYHIPTGRVISYPDPDDPDVDPEPWQEDMDFVAVEREQVVQFERMTSSEEFRIMEAFVQTVPNIHVQSRLLQALENRKPFRHFKQLIDASAYRQDWFSFRDQAHVDHVREQVDARRW